MKSEIKQLWTAALLSGQYPQTKNALCKIIDGVESYCCLGVLCELAAKNGVPIDIMKDKAQEMDRGYRKAYDGHLFNLPPVVKHWAELPILSYGDKRNLPRDNDSGKTFAQIAAIIQENF